MYDGEKSAALRLALELVHVPSQVRHARASPLPLGVSAVLSLAAGDQEAVDAAMAATGRSVTVLKTAAEFFIVQVLFAPEADCYRVLGATPETSSSELRQNMALLVRWLHPDAIPKHSDQANFIARVTHAWDTLKTPERRAHYHATVRRPGKLSNGVKRRSRATLGSKQARLESDLETDTQHGGILRRLARLIQRLGGR